MPLVGFFCAAACSALLAVTPNPTYDAYSEATVSVLGVPIGHYVDNEQPDECASAQIERAGGLVIAGIAPGVRPYSCGPGVLMAQEWYPFDCRFAPGSWGPIPPARAYILQGRFAWPGCGPPTVRQHRRLFRRALARRPALILWY